LKNAKRRAKKRAEGQKTSALDLPSEPSLDSTAKSPEKSEEEPPTGLTPEEKQKRVRFFKKIKQIAKLKEQKGQSGNFVEPGSEMDSLAGTTLEKEQLEKIETEDAVLAELNGPES